VFIGEQASAALDSLVARGMTQTEAIERGLVVIGCPPVGTSAVIDDFTRQFEEKHGRAIKVGDSGGFEYAESVPSSPPSSDRPPLGDKPPKFQSFPKPGGKK